MDRIGLINRVKIKLDEYTPDGVSLPFDDYLGPLLDESAREILMKGPLHLITPTAIPLSSGTPPASIVKYANNKSYIPVPTDYIRLHEIKYPLWKRSVRTAITPENPEYQLQENEHLTAGYGRPFVALVHANPGGGAVVKYFECGKVLDPGQTTLTPVALYVKTVLPEELNNEFADALTWLCTSKVFGVLGHGDQAKLVLEQFTQSLSALFA